MAIAKIKCLRIIGLMDNLYDAADVLCSSHCFQPDDPYSFYSDTKKFLPVQTSNDFHETTDSFMQALEANGISCVQRDLSGYEYTEEGMSQYAADITVKLNELEQERTRLTDEMYKCRTSIEQIKHFLNLDLEMEKVKECRFVKANFGRIPRQNYDRLQLYSDNPFVMFIPCSTDDEYYWGVYMAPVEKSDDVDRIFSSLFFERCDVLDLNGTPEHYYEQQNALLPQLEEKIKQNEAALKSLLEKERETIDLCFTVLSGIQKRYELMSRAVSYNKSFIMIGWVPAEKVDELRKTLSNVESVECTANDGKNEIKHSPPIKLKNSFLTRGFEMYTEMYGLPNYSEFDPTSFIAITYTILFGIMFGDVGHGLIVLIAGIYMKYKRKMPIGSILIPCGISGSVFGLVYGSVFGFEDALNPLYKALFGLDEKPISVMEPATTNYIIYIAIGIGILLVTLAMLLNVIVSFKRRDIGRALFDSNGVCGIIFYAAVVVWLVCQMLLDIEVLNPAYIVCLIVLPLLLIFLKEPLTGLATGKKNWQPEKWGDYCVQSFFELFEVVLSYVTNTMSFLRVGAFVLVHAGMMEVVFTLADMTSGVGYIAIVIVGNIIVAGLEALLVCIQVLRLEFYEMFGRFYDGDGRAYAPANALPTK